MIERIENLKLFYLYVDCEPVSFEKAAQEKKWRDVIDEKMKEIINI